MDTIATELVLLRMFRESDLDAYAEMCADPEVMQYLGDGRTLSRDEAWRNMAMVLGHWHLRGFGLWAVEERERGALVGRVGCWRPEGWPGLEIGWTLRRNFWGCGYATVAARLALEHAFTVLDQPRVISLIQPRNASSIRVARRIGMRRKGIGEVMGVPVVIYGMDRRSDLLVRVVPEDGDSSNQM